jgi:hypothetical protein
MRPIAGRFWLLWWAAIAAPALPGDSFQPGPLSRQRLEHAAEAAGFQADSIAADLPTAIRPRLQFTTFNYDDPALEALRKEYPLEEVARGARDEWTAQLRLKDWVFRQIPGGTPRSSPRTASEILKLAAQGERFWCTYYAITYTQAAHALGWQARKIGVDRKHGPQGMGSTHHGAVEIWSNQFRKWALIDAQSNLHFEKKGAPLSAWEVRAEWLKNGGSEVDHVVGAPPHTARKNPAMVWSVPDQDEIATYYWLYIDDHAATPAKGSRYILVQDEANSGEIWYQNDSASGNGRLHMGYIRDLFLPTRSLDDAYWTVGVVEAQVTAARDRVLRLSLDSYCPNRVGYQVSRDGVTWQSVEEPGSVEWPLKAGWNTLRLRAVSRPAVTGPETSIAMHLQDKPRASARQSWLSLLK